VAELGLVHCNRTCRTQALDMRGRDTVIGRRGGRSRLMGFGATLARNPPNLRIVRTVVAAMIASGGSWTRGPAW
jgi:hypothetical protein